ncbi:MAG TPA: HAMP domain-containing sensor histidine kinase [Polyangiaceae bacterium]
METRAGIRVQIVVALGTLMLIAFVPLGFAVSSLATASELVARRKAVVAVAHAIAVQARDDDAQALTAILASHLGELDVDALAAVKNGQIVATAGDRLVTGDLGAPGTSKSENGRIVASAQAGDVVVVARAPSSDGTTSAPLVRLVTLYVSLFAMTLLIFMYFTLTRVLVRPLVALAAAVGRVAGGSRTVALPNAGPRELAEVSASVGTMAETLLADERKLRAKVEELTRTTKELQLAQTQVVRSERMASVGRLAAGVAHEIGNPIAALMGMEDLLLDGLPSEESRDFLVRMKKETERIHTIVRDLLDFARPESAAESTGQFAPADVRDVAMEVAQLAKPQKAFRDVTLEIELQESFQVPMSSARLTQVLLNLLLNAGQALASTKDAKVHVEAKKDRTTNEATITVTDNGPGVPPDLRAHIFEPFVTTKEVGQGTGLGLSVCRGLVEAAGGTIDLDASYEGGARFKLTLPLLE